MILKALDGNVLTIIEDPEVEKLHRRVDAIASEASRLCDEIHKAAQVIWINVWFDDVTEDC